MLNVDKFFHAVLAADEDIAEVTSGRIFNTGRPEIDYENDQIPYIIVRYESGNTDTYSKENRMSRLSVATISIEVVSETRQSLSELTAAVYEAVCDAIESDDIYDDHDDWDFYIDDCMPSAGSVEYDMEKPCYLQTLTFLCECSKR